MMCIVNMGAISLLIIALKSLLLVTGASSSSNNNYASLKYTVPKPLIRAFMPKGIEVSIPHTEGVELFAFHGNINTPMDGIEAGYMSADVVQRNGNVWTYRNDKVRLKTGDTIYYWLFVIKDKLGYRYDNGVYKINEILPRSINSTSNGNESVDVDVKEEVTDENGNSYHRESSVCQSVLLNLTQSHLNLEDELDLLRTTNRIYEDLIGKHPETATELFLKGRIYPSEDPTYIVHEILHNVLNLPTIDVEKAERNNERISFYVKTLEEKITVIKRAKERLKNAAYTITY